MIASIIFGVITIGVFAALQVYRPGKSIFDR
jgi:hypothetical protein